MSDGISWRSSGRGIVPAVRAFAWVMVATSICFVANAVPSFWFEWPGALAAVSGGGALAWVQAATYAVAVGLPVAWSLASAERTLEADAACATALAAALIRWAFWSALLVGAADMIVSFLRVEDLLSGLVGDHLTQELGRPSFRGHFVHYPLLVLATVLAWRIKTLGFQWLALLIVIAEVQIVIARFVFSYEQAFMADLVRFWYAGLFLFASPYTLLTNGHVRVDVLYAGFSAKAKAWTNAVGSVVLGLPFCWVILTRGLWGERNIIAGPLLNFEVTQSGFGMYVKYLLAGYLLVFALAMLFQFASLILSSTAVLLGGRPDPADETHAHVAPVDV
jgi:TRAP-type mannitol/chloroaromatic compound transport system permease small subunit